MRGEETDKWDYAVQEEVTWDYAVQEEGIVRLCSKNEEKFYEAFQLPW